MIEPHQCAIDVEPLGGGRRLAGANHLEGNRLQADVAGRFEVRQQEPRHIDAVGRGNLAAGAVDRQVANECADRLRAGGARGAGYGHRERVTVVAEGARRIFERLLVQHAEPQHQIEPGLDLRVRGSQRLQLHGEHLGEGLPVAACFLDPRECAHRLDLVGQRLERLAIRGRRAVEIDEPLLLEGGDLDQQRRALLGILLARRAAAIRGEELGPVGELDRQLLEVLLGIVIVRGELEDLPVIRAGALGIREAAARDPCELSQQLESRGVVDHPGVGRRQVLVEHRRDLAPLIGLLGEPQDIRVQRRAHGLEIERAQRPRERERPRGELLLAELTDLRDLREPRILVRRGGELDLVHRDQPRPLLLLRVDRRQRPRGAHVRRLDGEHALPDLAGALERLHRRRILGRFGALLRELRGPFDERQPLRLGIEAIGDPEQRVDELLFLTEARVQRFEPREVARGCVELAQRAQRLRVVRFELEHALPLGSRDGRGAETIREHLAELLEQRDRFLALRRCRLAGQQRRDLAVEDLGEREVALLALVQRGEGGERLGMVVRLVRRLALREDRVEDLDREARVAEPRATGAA